MNSLIYNLLFIACKHKNIYIIGERKRQKGREEREMEGKRETIFFLLLFDCIVYIILLSYII